LLNNELVKADVLHAATTVKMSQLTPAHSQSINQAIKTHLYSTICRKQIRDA